MNIRRSQSIEPRTALQPSLRSRIVGSGEMAGRICGFDWAATSVGELRHWSKSMISHVNTVLASPIPTAIFWGPDHVALYNDAYCGILCEKHPHALGERASDIWQEIWPLIGPQYHRVYGQGATIHEQEILIPLTRDGVRQDYYWNYSVSPLYEGEELAGIITFGQNITDAILAREQLAENQERLQIALSTTGCIGMWDWHVQEDLLFADELFVKAYGADPSQAVSGMGIAEFLKSIHPDDLQRVQSGIVETINLGSEFLMEYRLLQEDGSHRWVEARGHCILSEDGTPLRFPGVTIDISGRKLAQSAIARGLISALPGGQQETAGGSLQETFNTLQEVIRGRNCGTIPSVAPSVLDEDYLRATSEMIVEDLESEPAASIGRQSWTGAQSVSSTHQKHLLYSMTMLLNDWVRSIMREDQESATRVIH
jgi:PAS domain S-box-containing protein